jgi:hypothetical protein
MIIRRLGSNRSVYPVAVVRGSILNMIDGRIATFGSMYDINTEIDLRRRKQGLGNWCGVGVCDGDERMSIRD